MRKSRSILVLLAVASGAFAVGSQTANARTYEQCVADEKQRLEYALPGESSQSIQDTAEALCGGRPKQRGGYQPSKKRAQKLLTQDSCMSAKKKGFKCSE
jgi:hypothetical protein